MRLRNAAGGKDVRMVAPAGKFIGDRIASCTMASDIAGHSMRGGRFGPYGGHVSQCPFASLLSARDIAVRISHAVTSGTFAAERSAFEVLKVGIDYDSMS